MKSTECFFLKMVSVEIPTWHTTYKNALYDCMTKGGTFVWQSPRAPQMTAYWLFSAWKIPQRLIIFNTELHDIKFHNLDIGQVPAYTCMLHELPPGTSRMSSLLCTFKGHAQSHKILFSETISKKTSACSRSPVRF